MTPNDEKEPEAPELSQEEVEEIVGGLGGAHRPGFPKPIPARGGVYGPSAGVVEYGSALLDYGSAP